MASDDETVSVAFGLGMVRALNLGTEHSSVSSVAPLALDALDRSSGAEVALVVGKHSVSVNTAFASVPSWLHSYCIPSHIRNLVVPLDEKRKKKF